MQVKRNGLLMSPWFALFLIALAAAVIYSNIYACPFVFDDVIQIVEKREIRDLNRYNSPKEILSPRGVVNLTFSANYRMGKLDVFGYHLLNVVIHVLNGFVVYFLARILFRHTMAPNKASESFHPRPESMALVSALIFVTHPIQTQAVTYTVQRAAAMGALFYMASVLFYLQGRFIHHGVRAFAFRPVALYGASVLCAFLAFLSKQNTASLPAAILLVEYIFVDRTWRGWRKKLLWIIPLTGLFVIFAMYTLDFFSAGIRLGTILEDVSELAQETEQISRWGYLCTQFKVLVIYIRLLFLPVGQNVDYLYPFNKGFFEGWTPWALALLLALGALGVWNRNKRPIVALAIFWFFITLSVESSVIPIRDALFEHRLYLPMFGFAVFVPYILSRIFKGRRSLFSAACVAVILCLGTATYARNKVWQDKKSLWSDAVSKNPQNYRARTDLGNALFQEGMVQEAIHQYDEAIRIQPNYSKVHYNLGYALEREGKTDEAIGQYLSAVKIRPDYVKAHTNLGVALARKGRLQEAVRHFKRAVRLDPGSWEAHTSLGVALAAQGDLEKAITHYEVAVRINPDAAKAHMNLGIAQARKGRFEPALGHLFEAVRLEPTSYEAHTNLGIALAQNGRFKEALKHFSEALRIKPDHRKAQAYRQAVLKRLERAHGAPSAR